MSGRHEAEFATELAERRLWQSLDHRLAVKSFGALVDDQQMPSSLETVFEGLAPGNLYRVSLYCTPIRQSAMGDVRRRDFNERWTGGTKNRGWQCRYRSFLFS